MNAKQFGTIKKAIRFVKFAHHGQVRKGSNPEPFYCHPRRVCKAYLRFHYKSISGMIAALCHDVVEDTSFALPDIHAEFGEGTGSMVDDLTKPREMSSAEYAPSMGFWSLESRKIKLCDLEDNILSSRNLSRASRQRMLTKWKMYHQSLGNNLETASSESKEFLEKWRTIEQLIAQEIRSNQLS